MPLTYAIADMHGRYDLLCDAMAAISAHLEGRTDYQIVTLGDYIDRGPESAKIIDFLISAQASGEHLICLKGNHEDIMLQTLRTPLAPNWWIGNGGGATLISYGHAPRGDYDPSCVKTEHLDWLAALPLTHVDQHRIFVHAGVERGVPLDQQDPKRLTWMRYPKIDEGGFEGRHVVHGHEQYEDGPLLKSGRTDLDTFAWYSGRLVVGVFDDDKPGGPIDLITVRGEPSPMKIADEEMAS